MKKQIKGLILIIVMSVLTGCGGMASKNAERTTENAAEYVQAAQKMLEEADSFAAEFHGIVSMNGGEKTTIEGQISMVESPLYMQVDTVMDFGSIEEEYGIYLEETDGEVNQYMNYDGEWTEMTMKEDAAMMGVQIYHTLQNMKTILSAAENWTIEKDRELKLTGIIPEGKFHALEESTRWFQLGGMSGLSAVYFAGIGDVPVTVMLDGKTGEPLSYKIELAKALETVTNNVLAELHGDELENGVVVGEYSISSELTRLGGVKAAGVPAEAKSDAINYEKEIAMLENE